MSPYIIPGIVLSKSSHTKENILEAVCNYYGVSKKDICSRSRKREYTVPRHIFFYLVRQCTKEKLISIGKYTGNRDHTTVMNGAEVVASLLKVGYTKITTDLHNIQMKIGAVAIIKDHIKKLQVVKPERDMQMQRAEW